MSWNRDFRYPQHEPYYRPYSNWDFAFLGIASLVILGLMLIQPTDAYILPIANVSVTITPVNQTPYNNFLNAIGGTTNSSASIGWESIADVMRVPWTSQLGNFAYLIIALIPFSMLWIRQSSTLVPLTLALIFGAYLMGMIPAGYVIASVFFVGLGILAIIFGLYQQRK